MRTFSAKFREKLPNSLSIVDIYEDGKVVGSYKTFENFSKEKTRINSFVPFHQDGKYYALYYKCRTAIRVMSLPECKDLGGEKENSLGFFLDEIYIPGSQFTAEELLSYEVTRDEMFKEEYIKCFSILSYDKEALGKFGFVSGCHWGDDTSMKLMFLDLSDVKNGNVKKINKFGYLPISRSVEKLKDAIDLDLWGGTGDEIVTVATDSTFYLWCDYSHLNHSEPDWNKENSKKRWDEIKQNIPEFKINKEKKKSLLSKILSRLR